MGTWINVWLPKKDRLAFFTIAVLGSVNHFLYEWTKSAVVALFCPVNESVWEHLKLLVFPFLFWSVGVYICRKCAGASVYFYCRLLAVLNGMLWMVILFYTYTGVIGRSFLPVDILIFFVSITVTLHTTGKMERRRRKAPDGAVVYTAWMILILLFFLFTCFAPELPLFCPPELP